jgi:glycosyltransferase involved in cell wall biosynthesis
VESSPENNNQSLVSVGMPTYNRPEGLRRTLECITQQTYKNLEIIVSDNCSPGNETEKVVREFMEQDDRIQYYKQEENKGAEYNFKFVLKKASGEFFMWAADDDEWEINYIERIITLFKTTEDNIVAINLEAQYVDEIGEKFDFLAEGQGFYTFISESKIYRLKNLLNNNYGNLIYSIYRKETLNKIENLIFTYNEIPFMLQIVQYGNWKVIPDIGFYKRTTIETYSQAKWEMCGGRLFHSKNSIMAYFIRSFYSFKYHSIAFRNIITSINSLTLTIKYKLLLKIFVTKILSIHLFWLLIRYKPKKNFIEVNR